MTDASTTVMVVDDDLARAEVLAQSLAGSVYRVRSVADAAAAVELLQGGPGDVLAIVLDRAARPLNGAGFLGRLRRTPGLAGLPVILGLRAEDVGAPFDGLAAGHYDYLVGPHRRDALIETLDGVRVRSPDIEPGPVVFRFADLVAARDLASILSASCPDPKRVVIGLSELLVNAVEHGNLGISFEEKARLHEQNRWEEEVARRLATPELAARRVTVEYWREPGRIRIGIRDEGDGFDWRRYLEVDPARVMAAHGRGIAMANMLSFDTVDYRGAGNEVEVLIDTRTG